MKVFIKKELEDLKTEYGYIPATSKFRRSLQYKISNIYGTTKSCIIDLFGEEEYVSRRQMLYKGSKGKNIKRFQKTNNNHYNFIKYWTSIFLQIEYLPSKRETDLIPCLELFYFSMIIQYGNKENYIKHYKMEELYKKSLEIQTKVKLNKRVEDLNIKLKPFVEEMETELEKWINLFKDINLTPSEKYIQSSNDDRFVELFILILSLYNNYDNFVSSNKLKAEIGNKNDFEELYKNYIKEA